MLEKNLRRRKVEINILDVDFHNAGEFSIAPKNRKYKGVIMIEIKKENQCPGCRFDEGFICAECWKVENVIAEKRLKIDVGTAKFVSDLAVKELNRLYEEENTGFIFNLGQPKIMFNEV